jgi:hypothetical protein
MDRYQKLINQCDKNIVCFTRYLDSLKSDYDKCGEINEYLKIKKIEQQYLNSDLDKFQEIKHFNHYYGYVIISLLDLSVDLKNLVLSRTEWERIYFIKHSYLVIYETIVKLHPSSGKSFVQLKIEKEYPALKDSFLDLISRINDFRTIVDYKKISNSRKYIAGHIEKSLKTYYDTALSLDGDEAGKYISKFLKILCEAMKIMQAYKSINDSYLISFRDELKKLNDEYNFR